MVEVRLPRACSISKVVLHSSDVVDFDLFLEDGAQGMRLDSSYRNVKGPIFVAPLRKPRPIYGIRLKIVTARGDKAKLRAAGKTAYRGGRAITGATRAAAKIYEIELVGSSSKPIVAASDADTPDLDALPSPAEMLNNDLDLP